MQLRHVFPNGQHNIHTWDVDASTLTCFSNSGSWAIVQVSGNGETLFLRSGKTAETGAFAAEIIISFRTCTCTWPPSNSWRASICSISPPAVGTEEAITTPSTRPPSPMDAVDLLAPKPVGVTFSSFNLNLFEIRIKVIERGGLPLKGGVFGRG